MSFEESRAIVVLGMHRSGTSVVTQLISELGVYAGRPDELIPPDPYNPTGFWEHLEAVRINRDIFAELGATWTGVEGDLARLSSERRAGYVARAKRVVQSLQGRGPFVLKDPRISLLFPLWREALPNPICVIAWRDPMAVAQSLATRDLRPRLLTLAEWEHYNRTLLRDTIGEPRVLVAYEDLLTDPIHFVRELHAALTRFGLEGLSLQSEERIRQIVNFDRNGRTADESLLDAEQRSLLAGLHSGAALRDPVPSTSAHKSELFAEFGEVRAHRKQLEDYDSLLNAVFESRSWRLGHSLTGLLRLLRKSTAPSAVDRWKEMMRRRSSLPASSRSSLD